MASEIDYNPFASKTLKDPFTEYDKLREKCPVHKFDDFSHPLFTVTRYEDVVQLLTNIDMWSSHYGQMPRYSVQGCLFSDPPQHTWYRKLIQKSFAPRHVAAMESEISSLVDELLDEMESKNKLKTRFIKRKKFKDKKKFILDQNSCSYYLEKIILRNNKIFCKFNKIQN